MKLSITQPLPPYSSVTWEVKKNEPDGWAKAWKVTRNGEHVSYFRYYDDATYWVHKQAEGSLLRG